MIPTPNPQIPPSFKILPTTLHEVPQKKTWESKSEYFKFMYSNIHATIFEAAQVL